MLRLQKNSLDWALAHALRFGDGDVFPLPFEYEAVKHDWTDVRSYLAGQNILDWTVRPHRTLLAPKARYGFRVVTQLDPLDFLVFAAVIKELAADIEARRVPKASEIVLSYRSAPTPDGLLFDPSFGYQRFQTTSERALTERPRYTHVGITDISDFYPRIYLHRLENALQAATRRNGHVQAVKRLLSGWNGTETFGIPVGSAPVRLLAELTIADVDNALLMNQIRFVRFNDDYRLFARSYSEAYRHVAFLADTLFRNHGLTLQPQKTSVLTASEFKRRVLKSHEERELDSMQTRFAQLAAELGIDVSAEQIDYNDLDDDQKALVDSLNLAEVFREEVDSSREPDFALVRFILRRLGQLGDQAVIDDILANLDSLHPVFPDIIRYVRSVRDLSASERRGIGDKLLSLLSNSIISELEYHRMWALNPFTHSTEWDNESRFPKLLSAMPDQVSRRELILAMGRARHQHWFQSRWRTLFDEPPWPRRALIAAASCMPPDARRQWYRSIETRLDPLEKAVMRWARQHPFGGIK